MPHILDPNGIPIDDSIPECLDEQFAVSETMHANIESGKYTVEALHKANELENHWKEQALHILVEVEKITSEYEKFFELHG